MGGESRKKKKKKKKKNIVMAENGEKQNELLAQLAAKDEELLKLKDELMRLKGGSVEPAATVSAPAVQPTPPVVKKPVLLSHLPFEIISTRSPDGGEEWPIVGRVSPPADFAEKFSEMARVGCYCWRIVDKIILSSKGDRKQERVLAITAEFLFICDLNATINRVIRCRDVERVLLQELQSSVLVVIKTFSSCEEHSIILELRHDSRNPTNKPLQPIMALNYTRKPRTKTDLEVIRVPDTTDLRRHPYAGSFAKPQGYLAPHLKIQKWRETNKWPNGAGQGLSPNTRSTPGATRLKTMNNYRNKDEIKFTILGGEEVQLKVINTNKGSRLEWIQGDENEVVTCLNYEGSTLMTATKEVEIETPEVGIKRIALVKEIVNLATKCKIPTTGLPVSVKGKGRGLERKSSSDVLSLSNNGVKSTSVPTEIPSPSSQPVLQISFQDSDGDTSLLCLVDGKLQWWANNSLEIEACTTIKFHDRVLTGRDNNSHDISARIVEPTGQARKEMLKVLARMCVSSNTKGSGLPFVQGGYGSHSVGGKAQISKPVVPVTAKTLAAATETSCSGKKVAAPLNVETRPRTGSEGGSSSGSAPTWRSHNPYDTGDDDVEVQSHTSGASSVSTGAYDIHSGASSYASQDPFFYYQNNVPPSPSSTVHSDITDCSRPTLISSDQTHHSNNFLHGRSLSDCSDMSNYAKNERRLSVTSTPPSMPVTYTTSTPPSIPATPPDSYTQMTLIQTQTAVPAVVPQQPIAVHGPCMRLAVMFKHGRRGEYASTLKVQPGTHVIIEHPDGMDVGLVVGARQGGRLSDRCRIQRVANSDEIIHWRNLVSEENNALEYMQSYVAQSSIPVELHRAEYQVDKKKMTFHFSSSVTHPDFAPLVHHAHARFGCRIWMNNCQPKVGERGELIDMGSEPCPSF